MLELHKDLIKRVIVINRKNDLPLVATCSKDMTIKILESNTLITIRVIEF